MLAPGLAVPSRGKKAFFGSGSRRGQNGQEVSQVAKDLVQEVGQMLDRNDQGSLNDHLQLSRKKANGTCIICIGSTGTGKSSTISKCTGRDVPSGAGKDRVTIKCDIYSRRDRDGLDEPRWVDTVGWDDADLRDDNTFKDILRFIGANHLLCVKAIVWTVLPNVRKDGTLSKQARMINMFKEKEIWNNVIIICKQSRNPQEDSQGALAAARVYNSTASIKILGYTYLNDSTITRTQRKVYEDAKIRDHFNVKTDEEVANLIYSTIETLGPPIQVVFRNQKCLACSEFGDVRLMSRFCHMEKVTLHPGSLVQYHPGQLEFYHDSSTILLEHTAGLYQPWYSCDFLFCKCGGERYLCCKALNGQPGCTKIRSCCKKVYHEYDDAVSGCQMRYSCCKMRADSELPGCRSKYKCCGKPINSHGCRDVCKKCDLLWGTPAGECFETDHDIVITDHERKMKLH